MKGIISDVLQRAASRLAIGPNSRSIATREMVEKIALRDMAALGMRHPSVKKIRSGDLRIVVYGWHEEWGHCVYKAVPLDGASGGYHKHLATVRLAASLSSELFPKVWHFGPYFTVEEFVAGEPLKWIGKTGSAGEGLRELLAGLYHVSEKGSGNPLSQDEIRHIVHRYIRKAVRQSRYYRLDRQALSLIHLIRASGHIRDLTEDLVTTLSLARFPKGYVIDDLGARNVIRCTKSNRWKVVDVEDLKEGFIGFDFAWLIVRLTRWHCPAEKLEDLCRFIDHELFLEHLEAARATRLMIQLLIEIDRCIPHSAQTRTIQTMLLNYVTQSEATPASSNPGSALPPLYQQLKELGHPLFSRAR